MDEINNPVDSNAEPFKPAWAQRFEARLGRIFSFNLSILVAAKLLVATPILWLAFSEKDNIIREWPLLIIGVFISVIAIDYVVEAVERSRGLLPSFGLVFDRVSDYPLVLVLAWYCRPVLPDYLIGLKVAVDLSLLALYLIKKGSPKNRLRSGVNYATLLAMLFVREGLGEKHLTPEFVSFILTIDIVYLCLVALYNIGFIQKRFIADALSGANLLCGVFSMIAASKGRFDMSLLFLMLGAAFDGFDGAAARKFGGTSWGVYSDDVADGVNYGIAPGVALWLGLGGWAGAVIGIFYSTFTLSRLVFFTLNKSGSDPNFFSGVPSTMGGLITLSSLILFKEQPAMIGLMTGIVCVLMVSFDTHYRHLGRALGEHKRAFFGIPLLAVLLIGGIRRYGVEPPVALILVAALAYGFKPTISHLYRVIRKRPEIE